MGFDSSPFQTVENPTNSNLQETRCLIKGIFVLIHSEVEGFYVIDRMNVMCVFTKKILVYCRVNCWFITGGISLQKKDFKMFLFIYFGKSDAFSVGYAFVILRAVVFVSEV